MTINTGTEDRPRRINEIIDFHAHILPNVDHGSTGILCSETQIKQAAAAKVTTVVATPHFYPHRQRLDSFLEARENAYKEILPFASEKGINIIVGAEIFACPGIHKMKELSKLSFGSKQVLLIEMPTEGKWSYSLCESVIALSEEKGFTVVLAHIDRYDDDDIDALFQNGLLAQINADSVVNRFKRKRMLNLIDEGYVVALGSDIHLNKKAYKDYIKALETINKHTSGFMERTISLL